MKTPKHLTPLIHALQQGDLDTARQMLRRDDIRLKKHFLLLLGAALDNPELEPAEFIWNEFDRESSINHLPLKIQAMRVVMQRRHAKMCQLVYPNFRRHMSHTDQHNLACDALKFMDAELLSVCWSDIDFQRGQYEWRNFFKHPLCADTVHTLVREQDSQYLSGCLLALAHRFGHSDIVHDIFSHHPTFEVFQTALGETDAGLLHALLDQAGEAQEHFIVQSVQRAHSTRQLYLTQDALSVFETVALKRQRARLSKAVETPTPKRDMKRKM